VLLRHENLSFLVEQQFNQIEKQLISCNAKLESEQKQHARLQKEHEETGTASVGFRLYSCQLSPHDLFT